MSRPVIVYEYFRPEGAAFNTPFSKREKGRGIFRGFGTEYEEFESGPGHFCAAIVEFPSGELEALPVGLVKFDNERAEEIVRLRALTQSVDLSEEEA